MAIINHQRCYFLSGDSFGEERLQDGRGKTKVCVWGGGRVWSKQQKVSLSQFNQDHDDEDEDEEMFDCGLRVKSIQSVYRPDPRAAGGARLPLTDL